MTNRYYLSASGAIVPQANTEDHADVGRRILAKVAVTPQDYADIYDQMEKLGYLRVVEFPERVFAENKVCRATSSQLAFLQERANHGNNKRLLLINDELFAETRRGGGLTYEGLGQRHDADNISIGYRAVAPK